MNAREKKGANLGQKRRPVLFPVPLRLFFSRPLRTSSFHTISEPRAGYLGGRKNLKNIHLNLTMPMIYKTQFTSWVLSLRTTITSNIKRRTFIYHKFRKYSTEFTQNLTQRRFPKLIQRFPNTSDVDLSLAIVMRFLSKIFASPARVENRMCSNLSAGDATAEKSAEKNRQKFKGLNFSQSRQSTSLSHCLQEGGYTCDFHRALATQHFRKIASPPQA